MLALLVLFLGTANSNTQNLCSNLEFDPCAASLLCSWIYWNPQMCQDACDKLSHSNCLLASTCIYRNNQCNFQTCSMQHLEENCSLITGCEWQNGTCYDQSCITIQATTTSQCPTKYCLWSSHRNICYDKKCVDYTTQVTCAEISFCFWNKYRCQVNSTATLITY